ncbi:hypothetical protein BLSTO_06587 [Blastocystis sp. subtype 1]
MAPVSNYKTVCCYGCQIEFPENKTPFPSQMSVMTSIVKAFSNNQNALLESPTGTGKTLALLCSSMSWLKSQAAKNEALMKEKAACEQRPLGGKAQAPRNSGIINRGGGEAPFQARGAQ